MAKVKYSRVEIILGNQQQNWFAKIPFRVKDFLDIDN